MSTMMEAWKKLEHWDDETDLKKCVRRFFEILDTKETNDDGDRDFHPIYISSCRVTSTHELNHLLKKIKELAQ